MEMAFFVEFMHLNSLFLLEKPPRQEKWAQKLQNEPRLIKGALELMEAQGGGKPCQNIHKIWLKDRNWRIFYKTYHHIMAISLPCRGV